jgi:TRAP-type mannitol/chloroaromatic compound transport system permease large subunit
VFKVSALNVQNIDTLLAYLAGKTTLFSGNCSLGVLTLIAVTAGVLFAKQYPENHPLDETIVVSIMVGIGVAFVLALINRQFKLGLLSQIAEKTTFVLIPPLGLIFLVLGTIFVGIATPTEGGAMGATGAIIMALSRKRLDLALLKQAMYSTAKLTTFVLFILVGARVFSLTFYGVDGHVWVEHLLHDLPGGQIGFLIVVNLLVFGLAFFLDFFELAFIVVPLLAPVAEKLGIDLVWFGVLLAVNMQTSFMHPPFGFALFYLRSVAATKDYTDKVTGKLIERVKSSQIYWGAVPFVLIQLSMVAMLIAFPNLVTMGLDKAVDTSGAELTQELQITPDANDDALPPPVMEGEAPAAGEEPTPAFNASDFAGDGKEAGKP